MACVISLPPAYYHHAMDSVDRPPYGMHNPIPLTPPPPFPPPPQYEGRRRSPHTPRRNGGTEHIVTSREHPWVKLRLRKSSASSSSDLPSYRTGDEIYGVVELDLKKDKVFQSIDVSLRGSIALKPSLINPTQMASPFPTLPTTDLFLNMNTTIWKPSMGDPRSSYFSSLSDNDRLPASKEFKEKLNGNYSFPFMFHIPSVTPLADRHGKLCAPPPSVYDSTAPISVVYQVVLSIQTALFKSDVSVTSDLVITPTSRPDPPSVQRELRYACLSDLPPPGPEEDPEGWEMCAPALYNGRMQEGGGIAELRCTMALSAPRSYTRGYTLPLKVLLEPKPGSLASARSLALLTNSSAASLPVRVVLVRRTTHQESYKGKRREKQELSTAVAVGSCWVAPGYRQTASSKTIDCEIKLKKDLIPSFEYGGLKVDYIVALMPFEPKGLTPVDPTVEPITSAHVKICAHRASRSAAPLSFIPPGCIEPPLSTSSRTRDDYERRLYPDDPLRLHQSLGILGR